MRAPQSGGEMRGWGRLLNAQSAAVVQKPGTLGESASIKLGVTRPRTQRPAVNRQPGSIVAILSVSFFGACHGMHMGDMGGMPPAVWDVPASEGPFEPAAAPDLDPAPTVVEVALEARAAQVPQS